MQTTTPEQTGTITREGERIIVVGHVRVQNRQQLRELAIAAIDEYGHVTIDLDAAGDVDSSGIAALITIAQYAWNTGKDLVLANAPADFREFVQRTHDLQGVFTFAEDAST
jgi:anti-anti-sigma regulatory factor